MSRPKKSEPFKYGDKKERFQFLLTPEASNMLDSVAEQMRVTRSEILERLIRSDCLTCMKLVDKEKSNDLNSWDLPCHFVIRVGTAQSFTYESFYVYLLQLN